MRQSQDIHPAARLLRLIERRDLTLPGKCESELWRAVWQADRVRRSTLVRIIAPTRLSSEQQVETILALAAEGLGGVMAVDTGATEFHFRQKFAFTADLREEEDEQGRPRFVNMATPFQLGSRPLDFFPTDGAA